MERVRFLKNFRIILYFLDGVSHHHNQKDQVDQLDGRMNDLPKDRSIDLSSEEFKEPQTSVSNICFTFFGSVC